MKRVLFTGDSITKGRLGCSFLDLLERDFSQYELVNLGQNGDTLSGIMERTLSHLKKDRDYTLIVIAAGHNDIILPDFMEKSLIHRSIVKNLARKGSIPAKDLSEFLVTWNRFFRSIQQITPVPLIITTLSCLNENLDSSTNNKREIYNRAIRAFAQDNNLTLADVAGNFDDFLNKHSCRDYFMNDLSQSVISDAIISRTSQGADRLSEKRSLYLTIDGIHLNSRGAEIYRKTLSDKLVSFL